MKKLLIIAILGFASTVSMQTHAQTVVQDLYSNPASGTKKVDTVINTATVTMTALAVTGTPKQTTVFVKYGKLSGTVAGVATLKGSLNGSDWVTADTLTYTVTDLATQNKVWLIDGAPFLFYRVETVGSGTSSYTVAGQILSRKL